MLTSGSSNQIKEIKRLKSEYWRRIPNQKIPKAIVKNWNLVLEN